MKEGEGLKKKGAEKDEREKEMNRQKSAVYLLERTGCSLINLHTLSTTSPHLPSLLSLSHTHKHTQIVQNEDRMTGSRRMAK